MRKADDTITANFVIKIVRLLFILIGIMLALNALGFENIAGGLLAGAGIGAIALGFAFKAIGENFLAGIILIFDRPFEIGDTVTVNENMGIIMGLKFRSTHIKTFDGRDVFVPNATVVTNDVYNHTRDGFLRQEFIIGIDYDDDIDKAERHIVDIVNQHQEVLRDERTQVVVHEFGTNTVNLKIMFWINTKDYKIQANAVRSKVMKDVKKWLLENKFGLPANIQEIKMYRPDPIPVNIITTQKTDL